MAQTNTTSSCPSAATVIDNSSIKEEPCDPDQLKETVDPYVVQFEPNDPQNPKVCFFPATVKAAYNEEMAYPNFASRIGPLRENGT